MIVLITWSEESSTRVLTNQVLGWMGGMLLVIKKNGGKRRNRGEREEGCSLSHKLNIIDGFLNEFN